MHLLYLSLLSIFLQSATLKSSVWRAESAGRLPSSRVFRCGLSCTQPYDRNVQYIQMTTRRKVFSSIFFSIFYDGDMQKLLCKIGKLIFPWFQNGTFQKAKNGKRNYPTIKINFLIARDLLLFTVLCVFEKCNFVPYIMGFLAILINRSEV